MKKVQAKAKAKVVAKVTKVTKNPAKVTLKIVKKPVAVVEVKKRVMPKTTTKTFNEKKYEAARKKVFSLPNSY